MGSITPSRGSPQFLVIGAGQRGEAYARGVTASTTGKIAAVAEIDSPKRLRFGQKYIWANESPRDGEAFASWEDFIQWETERRTNAGPNEVVITGVFICTLDDSHAEIIHALAPLNLHIMCEKPLALSLSDCLLISNSLKQYPQRVASIGHVLRYSPHNMLLRDLVVDRQVIGEIVSIEHTEPVGWWHFAHSYVRGNWRRAGEDGVGSLLTKSCHDIDFILWMLCSPSTLTGETPHLPSTIFSHGTLTHFRRSQKPPNAGNATNCLACPVESDCIYSAKNIYLERKLRQEKNLDWPVKVIVPDIEDAQRTSGWEGAESHLLTKLTDNYDRASVPDNRIATRSWYGRCVYESDNDVVDDQTVVITWDDEMKAGRGPKQAMFHMTYPTEAQCERRGRIYGTQGEIVYDSHKITVSSFATRKDTVYDIPIQPHEVQKSHGGGDSGLARAFVMAIEAVDSGAMGVEQAQRLFVGCDLDEIIRSHAVVFAAEEARLQRRLVDWPSWWAEKNAYTFQH